MKVGNDFKKFIPNDYTHEYYSEIDSENKKLLEFYAEVYKNVASQSTLLEFGSGPTIYSIISAAKKVETIHVTDYLEGNLKEVKKWVGGGGFDWTNFIRQAIECEGIRPTEKKVYERSRLLKDKINIIGRCDAFNKKPLLQTKQKKYDIVASNFCAESITDNKEMWFKALTNIFSLLKPNGLGVVTALEGAEFYHVGDKLFPATSISIEDLRDALIKLSFERKSFTVKYIKASIDRGYKGIIMLSVRKTYDS